MTINEQTLEPNELGNDADLADMFAGHDDEITDIEATDDVSEMGEPGESADAGDQEKRAITYKAFGEERSIALEVEDYQAFKSMSPAAQERFVKSFEKSTGAEIRDSEKNRRIAELERKLAENSKRAEQEVAQQQEREVIDSQVLSLEKYVDRYGDEDLAKAERDRDIRLARIEFQNEQDRRRREADKKEANNIRQLEQVKNSMKKDHGFSDAEIDHAIKQAPTNGCTTLVAALKFEYPERFVPGMKAGRKEKGTMSASKKGTLSGGRAPKPNSNAKDMNVASRLCGGASKEDLEKASKLIGHRPGLRQKAMDTLRSRRRKKG